MLDPACGSGNFLYLALQTLKDLEHRASIEAEALGLPREFPRVGPEQLLGIEINPYAAELARISVWIGEIQWMQRNGFGITRNPILRPLDTIECRDAILNEDGTEAQWHPADVIIGNPPFLGASLFLRVMGREYTDLLRQRFGDRIPGAANLVTYWFEAARRQIGEGKCHAAGLVATSTIRQTASRAVVERLQTTTRIFEALSDERWINEGAAVRVAIICFGDRQGARLDGRPVAMILSDLTGSPVLTNSAQKIDRGSFTHVRPLAENADRAFPGSKKHGSFDVPGYLAREWLKLPNPHGRSSAAVVKPLWNGLDVTRRPRDVWVIDFGTNMVEAEAALYERPFEYVRAHVKSERQTNNRQQYRRYWWRHGEPRIALRSALQGLRRYIAISEKSKHFYFIWLPICVLPDNRLIVIARDDDTTFGTVSSRFHRAWALRVGSKLEDRPCYTPTTCFQTFPFPAGLTPSTSAAAYADDHRAQLIASVARRLNELRENWLNPPDLVVRVPEVVPGYPDRILPKDEEAEKQLKKRTLTNLYNQRPAWLDNVHEELDAAVAAAYGWPTDLTDDEILRRLFELNQERATGRRMPADAGDQAECPIFADAVS